MPISLKNTASILPYIRYSPQANVMAVAGEDNKPREIPFIDKSFAIDIENGSMGWLLIGEGIRDWKPFPIDSVAPPSPGANYKRGFSVLLYAPKLLGNPEAHEMCASTGAHLSFCERLYNEAEPNFGKGSVPIVKITEAEPIKVGKGKSRELKFEIVKWISRPAAITEALAKLKAANGAAAEKDDFSDDTTGGDDFDTDDDVTAPPSPPPPKEEPTAKQPKKPTTQKPKAQEKEAQPKQSMSDILDDKIAFE
jgi:hypothetical protein